HGIRDVAIREVTSGPGAEFADVERLGEVHFEQRALAEGQWDQVLRLLIGMGGFPSRQLRHCFPRAIHELRVAGRKSCALDLLRHVVTVARGVVLHDLYTAAMAVHVAEAT